MAAPSPSDEIRYGFVGTGMMGCEHIRNVVALPGARPVAAADPVASSRAAALEAGGGTLEVTADVDDLLARDDLDAVVIATPNHTHRDVLARVLETDLHVLVEKPLCTTMADCLAVRDAARHRPGVVWMALEYRYMPPVARFLAELRAGTAGDVRMLSIREHRFPFLVKVGDWNRFTRNTGGTLVEKCCHFFDLMNQALPGRPVRVLASGAQDVNHLDERYDGEVPDILDNAFVIVDYDDGRRALLDLCMFAEGSRWEQELAATGDRGKVEVHLPNFMEAARGRRAELVVGSRGPDWPVHEQVLDDDERVRFVGAHHGASYLEHLDFCQAIRSGAPPAVTLDDGVWSVAMGLAAHRSIDEQRPVTLAEVGLAAG
ncbi:MAG: Gfo/Idh/MocA family oxidoreductase [Acidimicrobiales bacterium]|jgi:predicted dehydrogenase|nr:Gfo/Idh/MocA family oxidoreductase [Acidimicrobiales bacterium]